MSPSVVQRLCSGVLCVAVVVGSATSAGAAPSRPTTSGEIAAQVRSLDRQVAEVSTALAAGVTRYEHARAELARLTNGRADARRDVETRQAESVATRASFDELARSAYKGGVPPLVTALLSGDPRTVADLAYVQRSVGALGVERSVHADQAEQRTRTAADVLARSDAERRRAVVLQQAVDAQLAALLAQADELTAQLAVTADALVAARAAEAERARARAAAQAQARERAAAQAHERAAARAAAALRSAGVPDPTGERSVPVVGGTCAAPSRLGEANGFLPASTLCPLSAGRGHRLRTDAARAFERLAAAYASSLGRPICITDSYRSYAAQVDVFARKPSLAAVPGTSQHGWGLALDLCGGVQVFGSEAHAWMRANAPAFGWHHPQWARQGGRKPEPWHWEFAPSG